MTDLVAASNTEPATPRRKLPVWAIAGIVGVLGAVGGGALSTALVKRQAPQEVAAEGPAAPPSGDNGTERHAAGKSSSDEVAECRNCGVVEKVVAVKHKGEGTGVGAVAGGVVGGLLGHQVGGGNGKKAMTVVGAVGGGLAGHEIEKHARATTTYRVRVRMDDGTIRTITQASAPAVGSRIQL